MRVVLTWGEYAAMYDDPVEPMDRPPLTVEAAFLAASDLIWQYDQLGTAGLEQFSIDAAVLPNGRPGDPAVWEMWEEAVGRVEAGLLPRNRWSEAESTASEN